MKVFINGNKESFEGVVLDLSPIETKVVLAALEILHADGGENEIDRLASKSMRKQILEEMDVKGCNR